MSRPTLEEAATTSGEPERSGRESTRLRQLVEIGTELAGFESVERTLPEVLATIASAIPLRSALLLEASRRKGPQAVYWHAPGLDGRELDAARDRAHDAAGYLIGDEALAYLDRRERRIAIESFIAGGAEVRVPGSRRFLALPLAASRRPVLGTLQLEGARPFDEEELWFLAAVVSQLAAALERDRGRRREARLRRRADAAEKAQLELLHRQQIARDEAQRAHQRLSFLVECGELLAANSSDPGTRLEALAMLATGTVADAISIDLADGLCARVLPDAPELGPIADAIAELTPALETGTVLPHDGADGRLAPIAHALRKSPAHSVAIAPLRTRGETIGTIALFGIANRRPPFDTSDRLLAEEVARRAIQSLEASRFHGQLLRALHGRDRLLSDVTHELRNSLAALLLSARVIDHAAPSARERTLSALKRTVERMSGLVDDLVRAVRIDSADLPFRRVPCAIEPIVDEVLAGLEPVATAKRIVIRRVPAPEAVPALFLDGDRIAQLVANLVGNALKFTGEGGSVQVSVAREGTWVALKVRDDGIGIPADALPRIFDRGWHGDGRGCNTGLGLALCRSIAEAHGGTIDAESSAGRGTLIRVRLPLPASC